MSIPPALYIAESVMNEIQFDKMPKHKKEEKKSQNFTFNVKLFFEEYIRLLQNNVVHMSFNSEIRCCPVAFARTGKERDSLPNLTFLTLSLLDHLNVTE